jgi:N-acetylmuramoyl-L-alanine amidase
MKAQKLKYLVLHCTATPEGREIYPDDIHMWHTAPAFIGGHQYLYMGKIYSKTDLPAEALKLVTKNILGRGWKQVGYRDMIMINQGLLINLVRYNDDDIVDPWEITNGATGINSIAAHLVYAGGCDKNMQPKDTRTLEQLDTMTRYVRNFIKKYPKVKVAGHNQFAKKACPSFDVPTWLRSIGIPEQNIYQP